MTAFGRLDEPWAVHSHVELDSTNAEALRCAEEALAESGWVQADRQTLGRGRLNRSWESPDGNLFVSARFPYGGAARDAPLICFAAGLAAVDAIVSFPGHEASPVRLKWPNDLVVEDRKLGGILVESGGPAGRAGSVMVVGFGLNLATAPVVAGRGTVALAELGSGPPVEPLSFVKVLDRMFRGRLKMLAAHGFPPLRHDWLQQTIHQDRSLSCVLDEREQVADFVDIAEDGALVVRDQRGIIRHVRAGDVGLVG